MKVSSSVNLEYSDGRLLSPGKNYLAKRLVKTFFWLIILDSFILGFFGIIAILPYEEVNSTNTSIGSVIFGLGLICTILLTLIIGIYSAIGIPWLIKTLSYTITDEALIVRRGRLSKIKIFVPYRTITNIGITLGPFDRLFNVGHLSIETAGTALPMSGKLGVDQYIEGLDNEELKETYNYIYHKIKRLKGIYSTTTEDTSSIESIDNQKETEFSELIKELIAEIREFRKTVERLND